MGKSSTYSVNEFAAFFAHEIKNPLAVIRANAQLLELDSGEENRKCFDAIYSSIDKMNGIIAENMDFLKKSCVCEDYCDVIYVINSMASKYQDTYKRKFTLHNDVNGAEIECKKELIESLFDNLLKNAVEATDENGVITIDIKRKNKRLAVTVSDNGCGISDKDIASIGELFYTTKKGGSGVGLFMCRRIVEQNGGKFKISRNRPKGTKALVELNLK